LDGDVIVEGDIEKLWNIDLRRGGGYLAGVPDHGCTACHSKCGSKYAGKVLNAGVLLFNCKAMLEDNCLEKLIQKTLEVQKNSVCVEQEAIARVAYKRQLILPKEFNIQVFHTLRNFLTDFGSRECRDANCYRSVARLTKNWRLANPVEDGLIVHFNNNYLRPWKPMSVCSPYTDLWYRYLRLTHYFDFAEILKGDLICGVASIFKRSLQLYGWIGRNLLDVRKSSISLDLINLIP
jgi:lipopolysaccharide biosynthesis glycosyltransferase